MPDSWRTVRVFVSSTFRDMHAERNHLVRVVFPVLRERLAAFRVDLVDIDLRWGLTREQVENSQVLELCLRYVDECRPFYIAILAERYGWVPDRLPPSLLARFPWLGDHRDRSLTELEIRHAAFHQPQLKEHAFFFFRDPAVVRDVSDPAVRGIYVEADAERARKLRELKDAIRRSGLPVVDPYPARWNAQAVDSVNGVRGQITGLEVFGQRVLAGLWNAMRAELRLDEQAASAGPPDPLAEEADYHERFMESRLRVYVGRDALESQLRQYAAGADEWLCALTGPSGAGKSAALAHFVSAARRLHPDWLVVPHFIGASPESTDLRHTLRRFSLTLQAALGEAAGIPDGVPALLRRLDELIRRVPPDLRVVFVIDGLDQLDATDHAPDLDWLPAVLPPHVKVVVSCIEDPERDQPALDALNARPHYLLRVETLTDVERFQIVHDVPLLSAKTLDHTQVARLLDNPATANPLFLLVALEELRGFGSYERLRDRIDALPRGFDALDALFAQVIERLEEEFGAPLVRTILTSLAAARRGLSEGELRALVGSDDLYPVVRQLRPYMQHRSGLLDFYHRNLFKAVRRRYLGSADERKRAHAALGAFFDQQPYVGDGGINRRKVDELPWQRLQAEQWDEIEELFTAPAFLEAKTEAGAVVDLAADFHAMLERFPSDRPAARTLRLYNEALLRDLHFLTQHPTALFQCFWNSCWWYDGPQAAPFYAVPEGGWMEPPPWERHGLKLSERLEAWRDSRETRGRKRPWLRALRPPVRHLGTGELGRLTNDEDTYIAGLAFLPGTNRLLTGHIRRDADMEAATSRIRVWHADTGVPLQPFPAFPGEIEALACTPDGGFVVSKASNGNPQVWDVATRQFVSEAASLAVAVDGRRAAVINIDGAVQILEEPLEHSARMSGTELAFSPDGRLIAAARAASGTGWIGEVSLWDADTGTSLRVLYRSHARFAANSLAWFPDSRRLATGWSDRTIRIWDVSSGELLHALEGHRKSVTWVGVSNDGTRVLSASVQDRTLRLWDASTGRMLRIIEGLDLHHVAWSPDGRVAATLGQGRNIIRLWDVTAAEQLRRMAIGISGLAMSSDGDLLVDGDGRSAVVQEFESGRELLALTASRLRRSPGMQHAAFSPDRRTLATVMSDRTVRLWDLERQEERVLEVPRLSNITSLVFSPDGRFLAGGTAMFQAPDYCKVLIWETDTGALQVLGGHVNGINDVRFSSDGAMLASASSDGTVRLWNARSGDLLQVVHVNDGHLHGVNRVWFTADGAGLITVLHGPDSETDGAVWHRELATGASSRLPDDDDPRVLAEASPCRYRALVRTFRDPGEFVVKDGRTGRQIAWLPNQLGDFIAHPSGRMWAGRGGVVALEDAPRDPV